MDEVKDELRLFCYFSPLKAYDSSQAQAHKTSIRFMMALGLQAVENALGNHGAMRVLPGTQGSVVPVFMKSAPIATKVRDALVAVADDLKAGIGKVDIILSAITAVETIARKLESFRRNLRYFLNGQAFVMEMGAVSEYMLSAIEGLKTSNPTSVVQQLFVHSASSFEVVGKGLQCDKTSFKVHNEVLIPNVDKGCIKLSSSKKNLVDGEGSTFFGNSNKFISLETPGKKIKVLQFPVIKLNAPDLVYLLVGEEEILIAEEGPFQAEERCGDKVRMFRMMQGDRILLRSKFELRARNVKGSVFHYLPLHRKSFKENLPKYEMNSVRSINEMLSAVMVHNTTTKKGLMKKIAMDLDAAEISENELRAKIAILSNKTLLEEIENWFKNLFMMTTVGVTGLGMFYVLVRCGMSLKRVKFSGFRFAAKGKSRGQLELETIELRDRLNSAMVILESMSRKNNDNVEKLAEIEKAVAEKEEIEAGLAQEVASLGDDWIILNQMKLVLGGFYRQVGLDQEKVIACRRSNKYFFLDEAACSWDKL